MQHDLKYKVEVGQSRKLDKVDVLQVYSEYQ